MLGPVIVGEKVRLVTPSEEMLPAYIRWFGDPDITRYLGLPFPPSLAMEKEWFERTARSDKDIVWAIFVGDKLIGTTGIHGIDYQNRHAVTGSLIGEKDEWGKGYASDAHKIRTRYAFEMLGLEKIQSGAFTENIGSIRALEKSGYRQYGLERRHVYRHGRWHDHWLGELLREDWERDNTAPLNES